ncbi:MAG: pilus assembly protein PilM [Planctomycetaceae bacterium]|nr:pilus assembly protein PilM [Planctomycetaceae bacterium]
MTNWFAKYRSSPIGIDIGSRSVKLMQFDREGCRVREAARWDLPAGRPTDVEERDAQVVQAIQRAREGRNFRGREAVFCLRAGDLFVQNLRVPKAEGAELARLVHGEAAGRMPFPGEEAELRFLEAADVRHGDAVRREVIVMACHRPAVTRILAIAGQLGLTPTAIDIEPSALLRCYGRQFRRAEDHERRIVLVNVGASNTVVLIAQGQAPMFVKYLDVGGRHLDEAVARNLRMSLADATALRRHNGDRRADQRDEEITGGISESIRPVLERLVNELGMCVRYHSVTFRGQSISKVILGGGEACETVAEWIAERLDLPCELGEPLRDIEAPRLGGRSSQWDIAAGLALRSPT